MARKTYTAQQEACYWAENWLASLASGHRDMEEPFVQQAQKAGMPQDIIDATLPLAQALCRFWEHDVASGWPPGGIARLCAQKELRKRQDQMWRPVTRWIRSVGGKGYR
jgi:hypothetical protein